MTRQLRIACDGIGSAPAWRPQTSVLRGVNSSGRYEVRDRLAIAQEAKRSAMPRPSLRQPLNPNPVTEEHHKASLARHEYKLRMMPLFNERRAKELR